MKRKAVKSEEGAAHLKVIVTTYTVATDGRSIAAASYQPVISPSEKWPSS